MSIASFEQYNPHHTLFVMLLSTPPPDVQDTPTTTPLFSRSIITPLHFACSLCYHSHREGDFVGSFQLCEPGGLGGMESELRQNFPYTSF